MDRFRKIQLIVIKVRGGCNPPIHSLHPVGCTCHSLVPLLVSKSPLSEMLFFSVCPGSECDDISVRIDGGISSCSLLHQN